MNLVNGHAKITVGFKCNNRCIFCYDQSQRNLLCKTTNEIKREVNGVRKRGFSGINFIGGEPTIRPDIFDLIKYARDSVGFEYVMITTNGRMLIYDDFVHKIIAAGISQIIFSIHGHCSQLHDFLTCSDGSFKQLITGIKNLKKVNFNNIGTNTTIVKKNYSYLPKISELLVELGIKRAEFIYVCSVPKSFKDIAPMASQVAPYIKQVLSISRQRDFYWRVLHFPIPCYFGEYFKQFRWDNDEQNVFFINSGKFRLYKNIEEKKRMVYKKSKICLDCRYKKDCPGARREYIKCYGHKEIRPIS